MANRYWVGGGSSTSWSATAPTNWGTASNTQDDASVPGSGDAAIFDGVGTGASNATTSAQITVASIDFTGYANTFTNAQIINIVGTKLKLSSGMTWTNSGAIHFEYVGTTELTTAGKTFTTSGIPLISTTGNTVSMQDAWNNGTRQITIAGGTLVTNGYALTAGTIEATSGALTLGAYTVIINGSGSLDVSAGCTFDAGTSTIDLTYTSSSTFASGGKTYYNVICYGNTTIQGSNTFNSLTLPKSKTTTFTAETTQTLTTLVANGLSGQLVTMVSSSAGSAFTLSKSSGYITLAIGEKSSSTSSGEQPKISLIPSEAIGT